MEPATELNALLVYFVLVSSSTIPLPRDPIDGHASSNSKLDLSLLARPAVLCRSSFGACCSSSVPRSRSGVETSRYRRRLRHGHGNGQHTLRAARAMTDILHNAPIVLDNGSGTIRAGFAGDDLPKCFFPSWVGRPKHLRVLAGALEGDVFIGQKAATELRGLLKIHYPLEHGIVTDWDDMERIWEYVYGEGLKTLSEEHPVLLTEPPLNPRSNRDTAAQILFETFNVPALHTSIQAVLSLYASGRTTGIVLDSGDGVSHAVPVYEGFAMPSSIRRIDVAGRDVTEYLQTLLRKSGYVFHTSAEKEVVRLIKESVSYVAHDPRKEERDWLGVKPSESKYAEYVLPDGHRLKIGPERFRAPEILFDPEIIGLEYQGVHQIVVDAINRTDLDLRKSLYSNIVLSGGSTLTKGFGDRLLTELQKLAVKDMRIKIFAPPERKYSTWIGGSILAGLSTFRKMWVSIDDWHENPDIIHTKFT
ncbi:actin-1 [Purpureocillium lavendulum]|uniref:Actin-1 n=1 Tax=Purpureocillium lavendulum TaxID=1247861 RepID=A0AB34FDW6_9HYPO|nr:actin-1 [Purpureocillium lavendulum]